MDEHFYNELFDKHNKVDAVPSNKEITSWASNVIRLLFPEHSKQVFNSVEALQLEFEKLEDELCRIMEATKACQACDKRLLSRSVFNQLPDLYSILNTDLQAIFSGDPAARSEFEVIRSYPGFFSISFYRLAHILHLYDIPLLPRVLTEYAHSKTGIDIHPAAQIGRYFYIDHGTGIVIGETCVIGKHVKLYQGVTLGALSVDKNMAFTKRHPTVQDHVVIYSGATILGGETVIGHNSIIGGNVWLTQSVKPYSTVYHKPEVNVVNKS